MLIKATDIVIQSFLMYKNHWKLFFKYIGLLFIPSAVLALLGGIIKPVIDSETGTFTGAIFFGGYIALAIVVLVIGFWISSAMIRAISHIYQTGNSCDFGEDLADSKQYVWPAILATLITALAIIGGTALLIVPGIIIGVWYLLSIYSVLIDEIKSPLEAMKRSRQLVKGRWWAVLWRLLVPWIVFAVIQIISQKVIKVAIVVIAQNFVAGTFMYALTMNLVILLFILVGLLLTPFDITAKAILYIEMRQTQLESPTKRVK